MQNHHVEVNGLEPPIWPWVALFIVAITCALLLTYWFPRHRHASWEAEINSAFQEQLALIERLELEGKL